MKASGLSLSALRAPRRTSSIAPLLGPPTASPCSQRSRAAASASAPPNPPAQSVREPPQKERACRLPCPLVRRCTGAREWLAPGLGRPEENGARGRVAGPRAEPFSSGRAVSAEAGTFRLPPQLRGGGVRRRNSPPKAAFAPRRRLLTRAGLCGAAGTGRYGGGHHAAISG